MKNIFGVIVAVLISTQSSWAGYSFTVPNLKIKIVNQDDVPVKNAVISVYTTHAFLDPLDWDSKRPTREEIQNETFLTDVNGRVTIPENHFSSWNPFKSDPEFQLIFNGFEIEGYDECIVSQHSYFSTQSISKNLEQYLSQVNSSPDCYIPYSGMEQEKNIVPPTDEIVCKIRGGQAFEAPINLDDSLERWKKRCQNGS